MERTRGRVLVAGGSGFVGRGLVVGGRLGSGRQWLAWISLALEEAL